MATQEEIEKGNQIYASLLERCLKLELDQDYLNMRVAQYGETLEGLAGIDKLLSELEAASIAVRAPKKKAVKAVKDPEDYPGPIAQCGYKAVSLKNGTFNHVSSIESEDQLDYSLEREEKAGYDAVVKWAAPFGLTSTDCFAIYGPLRISHIPKGKKYVLCLLQERIRLTVKKRKKDAGASPANTAKSPQSFASVQECLAVIDTPATDAEEKPLTTIPAASASILKEKPLTTLSLFANKKKEADRVVNTETGETTLTPPTGLTKEEVREKLTQVLDNRVEEAQTKVQEFLSADRAAYLDELREEMGYIDRELKVNDSDHAKKLLRDRWIMLKEVAQVKEWSENKIKRLKDSIDTFEKDWEGLLQIWAKGNPPEKGKTYLDCPYGTLYAKDAPESYALDENDAPIYHAWLMVQWKKNPEEAEKEFGIQEIKTYKGDAKLIKAHHISRKLPMPAGFKKTEAEKDKFYIGPSLDTYLQKEKDKYKK